MGQEWVTDTEYEYTITDTIQWDLNYQVAGAENDIYAKQVSLSATVKAIKL